MARCKSKPSRPTVSFYFVQQVLGRALNETAYESIRGGAVIIACGHGRRLTGPVAPSSAPCPGFDRPRFWPEDVVACLLLTDTVSHASVPNLVPALIAHRSIALLELVLRHVDDLPETMVAKILQFALAEVRDDTIR